MMRRSRKIRLGKRLLIEVDGEVEVDRGVVGEEVVDSEVGEEGAAGEDSRPLKSCYLDD